MNANPASAASVAPALDASAVRAPERNRSQVASLETFDVYRVSLDACRASAPIAPLLAASLRDQLRPSFLVRGLEHCGGIRLLFARRQASALRDRAGQRHRVHRRARSFRCARRRCPGFGSAHAVCADCDDAREAGGTLSVTGSVSVSGSESGPASARRVLKSAPSRSGSGPCGRLKHQHHSPRRRSPHESHRRFRTRRSARAPAEGQADASSSRHDGGEEARSPQSRSDRRGREEQGHGPADGGSDLQLRRAWLPGDGDLELPRLDTREERLHRSKGRFRHSHRLVRAMGVGQARDLARHRHRRNSEVVPEARCRVSRASRRGRSRSRRRTQLRHGREHRGRARSEEGHGAGQDSRHDS